MTHGPQAVAGSGTPCIRASDDQPACILLVSHQTVNAVLPDESRVKAARLTAGKAYRIVENSGIKTYQVIRSSCHLILS